MHHKSEYTYDPASFDCCYGGQLFMRSTQGFSHPLYRLYNTKQLCKRRFSDLTMIVIYNWMMMNRGDGYAVMRTMQYSSETN